ncbi:MAG: ribosome silencing factor [Alistipes sp.]|nr:ribosome silencing factor [Alistipes sp.]
MSKLIDTIASAIEDKKGKNIIALDLSKFDGAVCPAFVICNADSTTQVEAIARGIEEKVLETIGEKVWRIEGLGTSVWVVMDYGDVLVHIFQTELRDFFKLEQLWADAPATRYASEEA